MDVLYFLTWTVSTSEKSFLENDNTTKSIKSIVKSLKYVCIVKSINILE